MTVKDLNAIRSTDLIQSITPPSNPKIGQRWLSTNDRMIWFWSGAYWLAEEVLQLNCSVSITTTVVNLPPLLLKTPFNIYVEQVRVGYIYTPSSHTANDYVYTRFSRFGSDRNVTGIGDTVNSIGATANNAVWGLVDINQFVDVASLDIAFFGFQANRFNNPSSANIHGIANYRYAR